MRHVTERRCIFISCIDVCCKWLFGLIAVVVNCYERNTNWTNVLSQWKIHGQFNYQLSLWLQKNFCWRQSKYDPLVHEIDLIDIKANYCIVTNSKWNEGNSVSISSSLSCKRKLWVLTRWPRFHQLKIKKYGYAFQQPNENRISRLVIKKTFNEPCLH